MSPAKRPVLFFLFFLSGFCGLVYQVVWTRLAFAHFGIITPVLSVVISVFMLGLALGAWAGGKWIGLLTAKARFSAAIFYALAELLIGAGAFAVPKLFSLGEQVLLSAGQSDSATYLGLSAVILSLAILPWCVFMGTTFPFMMAYVRERETQSADSFSYLYLGNVLGAMTGALLTALFLVEIFGFLDTLRVAACANFLIAAIGLWLGCSEDVPVGVSPEPQPAPLSGATTVPLSHASESSALVKWILFTTGFVAMAMEVVWTRAFTPVLKTQVYSFAMVVATYLGATFLGSWIYRRHLADQKVRSTAELLSVLCAAAFLPILANDFRIVGSGYWRELPHALSAAIVLASICPFCGLLGYLTPRLVDSYAAGSPRGAGAAYALNVLGCILGPLCACYLLLPEMSERYALILLSLPFFGFYLRSAGALPQRQRYLLGLASIAVLAGSIFFARTFEDFVLRSRKPSVARRDYAASVISAGQGMGKMLMVNGTSMTRLTPITKFMAHLPLAFHDGPPESALIICFGMGTTYRSALSWDVDTTAVELVPSVKESFGFYFTDAAEYLGNPKGRIVIDDGRRYLERTRKAFDVIVVDPPPPVCAAGSSLLYSKEFYALAKTHLKPGGILQAWIPEDGTPAVRAAVRSAADSFPHVRCFQSMEGWGVHVLASEQPIKQYSVGEMAKRLPARAQKDLLEWSRGLPLHDYLGQVLWRELPLSAVVEPNWQIPITDDLPYNEYFLLRAMGWF